METSNLSELHKPLQLQRKFLAGITQKKYILNVSTERTQSKENNFDMLK